MRFSISDLRALGGIDPAYLDALERFERLGVQVEEIHESSKRSKPADGMNKTERAFAERLAIAKSDFDIYDYWREPIKLRLAGRTWYTPDFLVAGFEEDIHQITFVEVKGFMRDDAAVKLKVAAEMFPCFRWLLVYRAGRHGWDVRRVDRSGIGREPIQVSWINGG